MPATVSRRAPVSFIPLLIGLTAGLGAGIGVATARGASPKYYLPALAALGFTFILVAAGRYAERVCLWGFLLSMPLPMHAFLTQLEPLHGGGAIGIYAQAPDFFLLLLYGFWLVSPPANREPRSWRTVLAFGPFLLFGAFSLAYSTQRFWALCEWIRWVKVLLIIVYATRRLKRSDVEPCLWVLAISATVQASVGILQAAMKSNLGLEKLGLFGSGARFDLTQEILGGVTLFRGSGLTSHPNFLASYLLLLLPLLFLRSLTARGRVKLLWFAALTISFGGLLSTMSRAAWMCFLGAAALAYAAAVVYRILPLRRAFQLSLALFILALILLLPFYSTIRGRFEVDFSDSWKLRRDLAQSAIEIAADHPVIGVGLNNYTIIYPEYNPAYANELIEANDWITVVHNVFLLVLAETGIIGLTLFLAFYAALFVFGLRELGHCSPEARSAILGLLAGILAALLCDLTEYCLWGELCMYTVAFTAGIIDRLNPGRPGTLTPWRELRPAVAARGVE